MLRATNFLAKPQILRALSTIAHIELCEKCTAAIIKPSGGCRGWILPAAEVAGGPTGASLTTHRV
jgi:hypothetical protein